MSAVLRYNQCNIMSKEPLDTIEMLDSTDSFEVAYETHARSIFNFLFWRTKDVHLSEDLTSSTFEKAWAHRKSFHGGSERAWLYKIAHNALIDHWRKSKELVMGDVESLQEDAALSAAEILDKNLELEKLQRAVDMLPSEMKAVIRLRFIEDLSCRQVADKLGLTESNVRVIQYRALKKLKGYLQ